MKETKKLYDSISNIDDQFIEEAQEEKIKKAPVWGKWAGLAACLCIVVIGAAMVFHPWKTGGTPVPNPDPDGTIEREPEPGEYPSTNIVPGFTLDEPDEPDVTDETQKTLTILDLSQGNPGEFAGDMHRPEGFHENIGSALALKMSITDDESYKFSVLIRISEGSTLEQTLSRANESLNTAIEPADAVTVNISGDFDTADRYFFRLTAEQIVALAESGTWCLYVGSGQGDHKDVNWDTRDGINTYCELEGDMYVLAGDGIEAHPDIGVDE